MTEEITQTVPAPTPPVPQSWETITSETPAAPAVEVPNPAPAVATTAPAETPALEPTAPLPADAAPVRESESQIEPETPPKKETAPEKDEDVKEGDTPEILALPSGSSSRRWAREQFQLAKPIHTFLDLDQPIKAFGDSLYERSESRYWEHYDDMVRHNPDEASKLLFGLPLKDVKARLGAQPSPNGQPAPATTPQTPSTVALPTEAELNELTNEQIAQRFSEVQQSAAQKAKADMEAAMTAKVAEMQTQLDAVTGKIGTHEQQAREAQVAQIQDELRTSVVKVVDEVIHDSGLEVKPDDPSKIANLKRAASRMIQRDYESAFDAKDENIKVIDRVREFAKRLEKHNVMKEEDNLKTRLRAACEEIKQTPEFKAIYDEIEAYANQSKATTRTGGPAVPAPGAPAGVTPKSPMSWDETIANAAAAS